VSGMANWTSQCEEELSVNRVKLSLVTADNGRYIDANIPNSTLSKASLTDMVALTSP